MTVADMHFMQNTDEKKQVTDYGDSVLKALRKEEVLVQGTVQSLSKEHDHVLKSFRLLIADLCQQFNGGHPGYIRRVRCVGITLTFSQRGHWHGCYRSRSVEICHAICAAHPGIFQSGPFRAIKR